MLGLIFNLVGMILFGMGALDKSDVTWEDVGKTSKKSKRMYKVAWFGVILIVFGFVLQICAII